MIYQNRNKESLLQTEVTFKDYDGDRLISVKKHRANMTVLDGRLDILEKPFGIAPQPTQRLFLNNMIPVPKAASSTEETTYTQIQHSVNVMAGENKLNRKIGWFCIGNGGENSTQPYVINEVNAWETRLYSMVPFRFVPAGSGDLPDEEKTKYRLRKIVTLDSKEYIAYYAKAFDPGLVKSEKNDIEYKTPVLTLGDSEPYEGDGQGHTMQGFTVLTYIQFNLEIDSIEFKEFYRATHNNSLAMARLSELGLITGWDAKNALDSNLMELSNAGLFAKMTHDVVFMTSEGSRRRVEYKVFS